jgi:hypothetical protein
MRTIALLHLGRRAISQGIEKRYEGIAMANKPARIAHETPFFAINGHGAWPYRAFDADRGD